MADPVSPLKPEVPIPTTVSIIPFSSISRMRLLAPSEINIFPFLPTIILLGSDSFAFMARFLSPSKPIVEPAIVVIIPVVASTLRMR